MSSPDIETLPDYAALRQVQDALWRIGEIHGAAVMIGAGFSRFANLAAETTQYPPLWGDFRNEMLSALYPSGDGPSDPLLLAEEYRAALGEQALENLIRSRIRDAEWTPGPLHRRLLKLPWADVLTTNWDTLLERAAESDPDMSYSVVRVASDIPRMSRPRIVKLHGSMPSHGPFIFSEEDFRTYPHRFAPFVNLAQQALLENELCLLGFSGDDPNFLQWAGWVRDQLGAAARPIRLIGVLNLSQSRRRLLERRNITPIDLAPLVSNLPKEDQHRVAAEIILESFWQARPKTNAEWILTPQSEYGLENIASPEEKLSRLSEIWSADRKRYPGWLIAPWDQRESGRFSATENLGVIFANLASVSTIVRLAILFECAWRWETFFWNLPEFLEQAIDAAAERGEDSLLSENQRVLLRSGVVRASRRRRDWQTFEMRIARLQDLNSTDAKTNVAYERCLKARDEIDYDYIAAHTGEIAGNDPVWLLRRAALHAELLDSKLAARAIHESYEEIRRRRAQDRRGLWLLSREAWASLLLGSARFELDDGREHDDSPDWPLAYKAAKADPWDELQHIDAGLDKAGVDRRKGKRDREPMFDAGFYRRIGTGTSWVSPAVTSPFDTLIRLEENAGLPLRLGYTNFLEERFARAIDVSREDGVAWAWLSLRSIIPRNNALIDSWFSRVAVARLPIDVVQEMAAKLRHAINFGVSRNATAEGGLDADWCSRIRTLTELLSRLSLRLSGNAALELFRFAASLLNDPSLKHWWLIEGISKLLRRSLQAIEPNRRSEVALEALMLPMPSEKKFAGSNREFPEVSEHFSRKDWSVRNGTHAWSVRISVLINTVFENSHPQSREHATLRLLRLFESDALRETEAQAFGEALWKHTDVDGLPAHTGLLPHVFLVLPYPASVRPHDVFETAVIKKLAAGTFLPDLMLSILGASYNLKGEYAPYPLNKRDALAIFDHVLARPSEADIAAERRDYEYQRLNDAIGGACASTIIPALSGDDIGADRIAAFFRQASQRSSASLMKALPALVRADRTQSEQANKIIRNGLLTRDIDVVNAALTAIFWFARFARDNAEPVPQLLISETVSMCLMRWEPGLSSILRTARWLVVSNAVSPEDRRRLIEALELIWVETSYDNWRDHDRTSDIGLIRRDALKLATALDKAGGSPAIQAWMTEAIADPMPEVRYALEIEDEDD